MTAPDDATFIALWQQGLATAEIARRLGLKATTAQSRAHRLQQRGLIAPRPRGGAYPSQRAQGRQEGEREPSTVHPETPDRPPSTVDPPAPTVHPRPADLTAAVTAALQPILARLDALETGLARQSGADRLPSTADPGTVDRLPSYRPPSTWELKPLKHSVRWTIYVPQALQEEIKRLAAARGQPPSIILQELLWKALRNHSASTPERSSTEGRTP